MSQSQISEPLILISEEQMVILMDLYLCSRYLMIPPDMLIKAVEKEKEPLPFMLSPGTLISMIFSSLEKIMVKKRTEQEIFSTLSGYQTSL